MLLREILPGFFGGLVATYLGILALRTQKSAREGGDGWKELRPGWLIHATVIGCAAFVLIVAYFFLTGGSTRYDAHEQNLYALGIMLGFGSVGSVIFWAVYLRRVAWLGDRIRLTTPLGPEAFYRFTDIVDVGSNVDGSEIKLRFSDGRRLRVNIYCHGFHEFMAEMISRLEGRAALSNL